MTLYIDIQNKKLVQSPASEKYPIWKRLILLSVCITYILLSVCIPYHFAVRFSNLNLSYSAYFKLLWKPTF